MISHTAELNYVQSSRQELRERAESCVGIVPGSPPFPPKMALIAIPYSQDESLFSNLIICHEIGHFVFEQLHLEQALFPRIERALRRSGKLSGNDLSWCLQRVWAWAEEIFCDRFAISLVGPAFSFSYISFSYIEMFDVLGIAEDDRVNDFTDTHPSDSCQVFEHSEQLRKPAGGHFLTNSRIAAIRRLFASWEAFPTNDISSIQEKGLPSRGALSRRLWRFSLSLAPWSPRPFRGPRPVSVVAKKPGASRDREVP